jgi:rod shape-determining protein MreD
VTGTLGRRAARLWGQATPALLTTLLVLPSVLPIESPGIGEIAPMLTVMAVFYWSVYTPELLPPWLAFAVGLLQDLVSGGPVGMMALILVLVATYVATQRRIFLSRSFVVGWGGFALIALAVAAGSWAVASLYFASLLRPAPMLLQALITVMLYPGLVWLLARAQITMMRQV